MISRFTPIFRFCNKIIPNIKNSIDQTGQFIAYGYYFPKEWDQQYIYSQLDASRKNISHLQVMRNRVGQPTGKVLFKFYRQEAMKQYIQKYHEDFIMTKESAHRIILKPFQLKTELSKQKNGERKTNHAVRIKNLDFDITKEQLERIGKDYGKVELVQMQIRPNGLNNGLATVYFKRAKQAQDFSYFCDRLILRQRKLSAEVINMANKKNQVQIEYLEKPKIVMQANQRLYKRMLSEQGKDKEQKK